jgi:hypothetical protein
MDNGLRKGKAHGITGRRGEIIIHAVRGFA